jgi:HlyD family secretion protein
VRNAPITVQNIVTYITVISVTNEDLKLKPGMTANVSLIIAQREDAVKLPNAALRFRPAEEPGKTPTRTSDRTTESSGPRTAEAGGRGGERRGPGGPGGPGGRGGGRPRERGGAMERSVYKLVNGKPEAVKVKLGITDGIFTEVLEGLTAGDQIITGVTSPQAETQPPTGTNPFSGGGGGGRRRGF